MAQIIYKHRCFRLFEFALNQAYLTDMSKNGLHVQAYNWGNYEFEKGEPQELEYKIKFWNNSSTEEQIIQYQKMGWKYLFHYYSYYFFSRVKQENETVEELSESEKRLITQNIKLSYIFIVLSTLFSLFTIAVRRYLFNFKWFDSTILCLCLVVISLIYFLKTRLGYSAISRNKNNKTKLPPDWKKYKKKNQIITITFLALLIFIASVDIFTSFYVLL